MFGWLLGSGCPLDPHAKQWVEGRLAWLRDEFGPDDLYGGETILPTPQFFPDPYDGSRAAVQVLFDRVCDYMGVERGLLRLEFFRPRGNPLYLVNGSDEAVSTTNAGEYSGDSVLVNEDQFHDPMSLVGTLAHELAHQRLLGENRIDPGVFDNELLTDLTVVFKGMGIFLANVPRHWPSDDTLWPGTELRKPEYMTGAMFGYALALRTWLRGDLSPAWARYVHSAARSEMWAGLRFLKKHGTDTLKSVTGRKRP